MTRPDFKDILGYTRKRTLHFSQFLDELVQNPNDFLHTSSTLIAEAIQHFGFEIVVRSGEPIISYKIFKDIFNEGTNAVFGQEFCIKHIVDVIDSAGKEAGPNRGIILVGPPASGKTNIIELMTFALEEYTKQKDVRLYSFFFEFTGKDGRKMEVWNSFRHNPILLFPAILAKDEEVRRPRQRLLEHINDLREGNLPAPTFYQNANLDKGTLDIIEAMLQNPQNRNMSYYDILEKYVRIEEIVFSAAQANSISNIDDMGQLKVRTRPHDLGPENQVILDEHMPGNTIMIYEGAMVASNRGILHIHDAFGTNGGTSISESDYKPLLMVLGSGKVSIGTTQASIDNTVMITTNLEEMEKLDEQLTSTKLLDRIEKIPVNYLLDASSEMEILKRDMANMREKYEVDPNLLRIAAYYAVMTRLLPPLKTKLPPHWSDTKQRLYRNITVEQKLFIFAYQSEEPVVTIKKLPHWHPFRNEAMKLGIDTEKPETFMDLIKEPNSVSLIDSELFNAEQLSIIDDEFMRELYNEHYPNEGRTGISVRQLQNIMRNTIAKSDGRKVHVGTFISQLKRVIEDGPKLHHWLISSPIYDKERMPVASRRIGGVDFGIGEGDYGDFAALVKVVQAIYFSIIRKEITVATVDRDPKEIEADLRRYLQYALLANALENKAFAHIMVPKFSFIHPQTGEKVDQPDYHFMASIEKVIAPGRDIAQYRRGIAQKFLELQSRGEILIEEGKNVINSRNDNVVLCFGECYSALISHRKTVDGINAELLRDAFFKKRSSFSQYQTYSVEIRTMVQTILGNMVKRFNYTEAIALDTIAFALRKNIVDFKKMIT